VSDLDKDLARVMEAYESAVYRKDVDAFMRLYDPDVRVFDTWGVWAYEGADAWRRAVEGWLGSLGAERVKATFGNVKSRPGKDLSSLSAIVTYAGLSAEGVELRAMQNRITWVLRTAGNVPRIVHEHTSAPLGFDDMKAILVRNPVK
jgi:ketosteroid isomerase-like protein